MNPEEHIQETSAASRFIVVVAVIMAIAYLGVGLFFLINTHLFPTFSPIALRLLGCLIIGYGAYRAYRVYKTYFVR
jgi:hypothetical protein